MYWSVGSAIFGSIVQKPNQHPALPSNYELETTEFSRGRQTVVELVILSSGVVHDVEILLSSELDASDSGACAVVLALGYANVLPVGDRNISDN